MSKSGGGHYVLVWDLPTRLFHLMVVFLVPFAWWTQQTDRMTWHKFAGFMLAGLLVFRMFWGFFGAATARFRQFVRGPRALWRYLRGAETKVVGHNPLGGWSVVLMLALLLSQVVLGLFAIDTDGLESGPLAGMVDFDTGRLAAQWHGLLFDAMLAAIGVHVSAIILYTLAGQNLIGPMLTGRKRLSGNVATPLTGSRWLLLAGLGLAGAVVAILWRLDSMLN